MDEQPAVTRNRSIDMTSLKGLAHPLRVRILDALSTYGPNTSSGLAERFGESSGSMSYHLRQLEKHGFVREDASRGSSRERWWERVPGGIEVDSVYPPRSAERAASDLVQREWQVTRDALFNDFLTQGADQLEPRWFEASTIDTMNLRLTSRQLGDLVAELQAVADRYIQRYRNQQEPGTRPVQLQLNAFPVMDAEEIPEGYPS
ncbi:ArsR family transcriptional regulator [Subtercola sp. Z020]|uniref:ArsR/SmtB family transcription factor n=1 Tax=Subtercola sp. Z020 TaxID=2080582 RepID=UPI000CE73B1F|nr:helix-turn-helix domain-containing protein [Subtercola sp. Z020]PPF80279.1 ArsR family transcriptional regulator [Subtercola sp. Z020]